MQYRKPGSLVLLACLLIGCGSEEPAVTDTQAASPQSATLSVVAPAVAAPVSNTINIGVIERIESAILGEERELWIYLPESVDDPANIARYPVVYLLDGQGHFHSVTGLIQQLSTINGNTKSPEMIVVGIPNTDRMRDLTPTHTEGTTGGGTAFLDFLEQEVIPHVEASYPASQYRTFIGHSLGGLMAIEALIERPELFANYVAIDPSLWWDDRAILHKAEAALQERDFTGKSLFVGIADTMRDGITLDNVREDTNPQTNHIRSILQFVNSAEASTANNKLSFASKYYENDNHGSVPLIAEYDALRWQFEWYSPSAAISDHYNPALPDAPDEVVRLVEAHYAMLSQRFGYEFTPPFGWVNARANDFVFSEKPVSARALYLMNVANYSDDGRAHAALADYFVGAGDEESARIHFGHAVGLGLEIDVEERLGGGE